MQLTTLNLTILFLVAMTALAAVLELLHL